MPQQIYRLGLADADAVAKSQHGKAFSQLDGDRQDALLQAFEAGSVEFRQVPAKVFFTFLLQNTREGFFSDPIHGGNQGTLWYWRKTRRR